MNVDSPERMRALGAALAEVVRAGDLLLLSGPLGAGKTTLTQGLVAALGSPAAVTSPTFVIARVYRGGRLPVLHVDAYRLGGIDEIDDLDLDASTDESVTVVEWGAGLAEGLADDRLEVRITRPAGADGGDPMAEVAPRSVEIVGIGERWAAVVVPAH